MKILIVDDNTSIRKVLTAFFVAQGHEVVGALADGVQVEQAVLGLQPDLICLDYHLPGRDGLSILRSLNSQMPHIHVVFITSSNEPGIETKAAEAGAAGFIRKPFGQEQILDELLAIEDLYRKSAGARVAAPVSSVRRWTAVVADDNGSVRLVLKALLAESGVDVLQVVGNGNEAVLAARRHQPNLICLDINMPVMTGLEALPRILDASPQTAVIMVTAEADKISVKRAADMGATGYILKPVRPAYIETMVKRLLH